MNNGTCSGGVAYIGGRYMPVEEATIPITDWGYRRSDVTYDVVGVWGVLSSASRITFDDFEPRCRRCGSILRKPTMRSGSC